MNSSTKIQLINVMPNLIANRSSVIICSSININEHNCIIFQKSEFYEGKGKRFAIDNGHLFSNVYD